MGIDLSEKGRIQSFQSQLHSPQGRLANGGVYWFNPKTIPEQWRTLTSPISLESDLFSDLLTSPRSLLGLEHTGIFIDIGVPEDYYRSAELL
jgi:D-glycero-alpha-D-manno-heptose 1-phosphate guanylyltransferase